MLHATKYYKHICKKQRRLPLDKKSLNVLGSKVKGLFKNSTTPIIDRKKINKHVDLLDDILIEENFSRLEELLSKIHTDNGLLPFDNETFQNTNYREMKSVWPQLHLIYELADKSKYIEKYEEKLREEVNDDIDLIKYFSIDVKKLESKSFSKELKPFKLRQEKKTNLEGTISEVSKYHKFLLTNQNHITHFKLQPLEVIYPTSRFALPLHVTRRDKLLKRKVTYIKSLLNTYKPIKKETLDHLINFSTHDVSTYFDERYVINPTFFTYMTRKRQIEKIEMNTFLMNKLRSKKLIPNDNNIRKIYKRYVMKQFYVEDDKYKMSWMQNFYEQNEPKITP